MKKAPVYLLILFNIIYFSPLVGQPTEADYLAGYGGMAIVLSSQLLQDYLAPNEPLWTEPNKCDLYFRDKLKWSDTNLHTAKILSDVLLWGFFIPSAFWTPVLADYKYNEHLLLNIQVLAAAGFLVTTTKFLTGRQRPYIYFNTKNDSYNSEDNISFFSGHSTLTFAIATTTSMMLQDKYNHSSGWIWSANLTLATAAGLLRIASDRHYMSDVLTGAVVGTLTTYLITKNQKRRFFENANTRHNVMFSWSFKL